MFSDQFLLFDSKFLEFGSRDWVVGIAGVRLRVFFVGMLHLDRTYAVVDLRTQRLVTALRLLFQSTDFH